MNLEFYKYQGTGNDFVIINGINNSFTLNTNQIKNICDRRFGIGADGFIILKDNKAYDFEMVYYNSDGNKGSMCGNGGRCIIHFANLLGLIKSNTTFKFDSDIYEGKVLNDNTTSIKMNDINIKGIKNNFLDTGSPHHIEVVKNLDSYNILEEGKKIRFSEEYKNINGTNVNFVEKLDNNIFKVRTFERGVENETLSCGTGVVAVSLLMNYLGKTNFSDIFINTKGGKLNISFDKDENNYKNIYLTGKVKNVFKGIISL